MSTPDPFTEALDTVSRYARTVSTDPEGKKPRRVILSEAEKLAILNLIRLSPDDFADVEEGAGVPVGTLDILNRRIEAAL